MQTDTAIMANSMRFFKILGIKLPYNQVTPFMGICAEKIIIQKDILKKKDTCTPVFTAAPFTIARTWKQPATKKWIKKMWYIHKWNITQPLKGQNNAICSNTEGSGDCYPE